MNHQQVVDGKAIGAMALSVVLLGVQGCSGVAVEEAVEAPVPYVAPTVDVPSVTNIDGKAVVKVDVKIKGVEEEDEETLGAFVHYEDDHGVKPFTPRGTNMLEDVEFSYEPKDLPLTQTVKLTFPDETLYEKHVADGVTNFVPAKEVYTIEAIATNRFVLHGHTASGSLRDFAITIEHPDSGAKDKAKFTVVEMDLVPDFNRRDGIDAKDIRKVAFEKTFHWWVNDDGDEGDCANCYADQGTEIPGTTYKPQNCKDAKVNGRTDLLDFFPLWTDLDRALQLCKGDEELRIRFKGTGIAYVQTGLRKADAHDFLTKDVEDVGSRLADRYLYHAGLRKDSYLEFSPEYLELMPPGYKNYGILAVEGNGESSDVRLDLCKGDRVLLSLPLKLRLHSVLDMMNIVDLCDKDNAGGGDALTYTEMKIDDPEFLSADTDVFSVHGFKVSAEFAKGWHAEFFKRLYQSGSNARFTGVTWPGYISGNGNPGLQYREGAVNAFNAAKRFGRFWRQMKNDGRMRSKSLILAHGLGNMLVSSAICDHGVDPNQYFMLNSAVASEAYWGWRNPIEGNRNRGEIAGNYLIQDNWGGYWPASFPSEWHRRFADDETREGRFRRSLTWRDRFVSLATNNNMTVLNYYSFGDEVLEISKSRYFWIGTGAAVVGGDCDDLFEWLAVDLLRYSWQKQEFAKGVRGALNNLSDYAGWGFNCTVETDKAGRIVPGSAKLVYSPEGVDRLISDGNQDTFKKTPVFRPEPRWIFSCDPLPAQTGDEVLAEARDDMLAKAIPTISTPMAITHENVLNIESLDMSSLRSHWGRSGGYYDDRWLHCDIKDMAYFYTNPLWNSFVNNGMLKGKIK